MENQVSDTISILGAIINETQDSLFFRQGSITTRIPRKKIKQIKRSGKNAQIEVEASFASQFEIANF